MIDFTHDASLHSWIASANGHNCFPIQNLPIGVFSIDGRPPCGGMAIGDCILDVSGLVSRGVLSGDAEEAAATLGGRNMNAFLSLGARHRRALRGAVSRLLTAPRAEKSLRDLVHPEAQCTLYMPAEVGDYTDFYAGIHHATAVGRLFRPAAPLFPNYKHLPVAYHGRSSSICVSGVPVRRPHGQIVPPESTAPVYEPTQRLDFELELGIWVGPGTLLGATVPIAQAPEHIAGFCLLNDWSARDVQVWEYQPLGPFLAKNFMTSISPWIVTPEALEPFRAPPTARDAADPPLLPYLCDPADQACGALDLDLAVHLWTESMRRFGLPPECITRSNAKNLYWTCAQMLAHHTSGGCKLRPGDLLGTGTISAEEGGSGSLLELTTGASRPIRLANGEERTFLEDGDEVIMTAHAHRPGFASIGFGECRAIIVAQPTPG